MRGAVTVGAIHHDQHIVFGPALNRAYELESKVAFYPRILIDTPSVELPPDLEFVDIGEQSFLDPFKPRFWDRIQAGTRIQPETIDRFNALSGNDHSDRARLGLRWYGPEQYRAAVEPGAYGDR